MAREDGRMEDARDAPVLDNVVLNWSFIYCMG